MPTTMEALGTFMADQQRCGTLDGGLDNGFVWLDCSCGGLIVKPKQEKPPRHLAASWPA